MKGNKKIGVTAEFVAIIKSKENPIYNYFVSNKAQKIYDFFNFFFKYSLNNVFLSRIKLSKEFDKLILPEHPDTIVDLGAGFSLRGFQIKDIKYIDFDFPEVIDLKKNILLKICRDKNISFPKNYSLIKGDLLNKYDSKLSGKLKGKTVFFAEGVLSYFNKKDFDLFIDNLYNVMDKNSIFIFNDRWKRKKSISYRLIRFFLGIITKSKSNLHFKNPSEAKDYFVNKGFSNINILNKGGFTFIKLKK